MLHTANLNNEKGDRILKRILGLMSLASLIFLGACGERVEVPPAHVGKISSENGLQEDVIPPSKFRLESFCWTCDNLILVEASDYSIQEEMQIYVPKDQLNLIVDVRGIFSISPETSNVNKVFARVTAKPYEDKPDRIKIITMERVYDTYARQVIREKVRSLLAEYSINQIMENREEISTSLFQEIRDDLSEMPITAIRFGLADVQPPDVIVRAREAAKEREIAIQQAEADKQVKLKEAEAALEVAKKQQQVDLKEAETQVLVNKKLAEGVNDAFVTQRWLKVMEKMAENPDANTFILPAQAINNPSLMMAINQKAMGTK